MTPRRKTSNYPYETTDITFAASLISLGKHMKDVQPRGIRDEVVFVFDDDGDIQDYFEQYMNGEMRIDPNSLKHHERMLKAAARGKL